MQKFTVILFVTFSIIFLCSCGDDEASPTIRLNENIILSDFAISGDAEGMIMNQNNGSVARIDYQVDSAYIKYLQGNEYLMYYRFTSNDSLSLHITKVTQDFNYHYPKPAQENQILKVYFNQDSLPLDNAAISIQPREEYNGFHTVVNIHTNSFGQFNGTVNRVPFVE